MFFFVSGFHTRTKELGSAPNVVCPSCGALTAMQISVLYDAVHLFFVPLVKFNRHYIAAAPCCGAVFELDPETGKRYEQGETPVLDPSLLRKTDRFSGFPGKCSFCGAAFPPGANFCPSCGASVK